jgi:nicotinamidase-related amidase
VRGRTALLAVDLQEEFVGATARVPVPRAEALLTGLAALASTVRRIGGVVVYTRFSLPDGVPVGRATARFADPALHRPPADALAPGVHPEPGDIVLRKPRQSAFTGTGLDLALRRSGVDRVVVTGVTSHTCCLATAIDAAALDYDVVVVSDLTSCPAVVAGGAEVLSAAAAHAAALAFMQHSCGSVRTATELTTELTGLDAGPGPAGGDGAHG